MKRLSRHLVMLCLALLCCTRVFATATYTYTGQPLGRCTQFSINPPFSGGYVPCTGVLGGLSITATITVANAFSPNATYSGTRLDSFLLGFTISDGRES